MKSLLSNKKGAVTDTIFVPVFILVSLLTMIIMLYVWFEFQDTMTIAVADSPGNTTVINAMNELRATYVSFDYMIPLLVGGLLIISLILAFRTGASVVYAFVSLFLWGVALLMSAVYTNIYLEFKTTFPTVIAETPILDFVLINMKWIVLAWLILISIIMFTRSKREEPIAGGFVQQ